MNSEYMITVHFYQDDEDEELLEKCVKKIKSFLSDELGWEWERQEAESGCVVLTTGNLPLADLFEDDDGERLLRIMKKFEVWSSWKAINEEEVSCSYLETDLDGYVGEQRYFSLYDATRNYDEEGTSQLYSKEDFELFISNIKKCLKEKKCTEKSYFEKIFKEKGNNYLKLKEVFENNFEDTSDLKDALVEWIEECVYKDWIQND